MSESMELEGRYTSGVYAKRPVVIVRGLGARVWDDENREYIDCIAGHGTASIGHCNPAVVEAIRQQAGRLMICGEGVHNDVRAALLEKLVSIAPAGMDRVFLCNSGTESVEAALKFARLTTGRPGIVAAMRGFHGRTMGALSATWEREYREPFEPLVPGFVHVPYNNLARLAENVGPSTAAVILEVVQGEGGVRPGTHEFLQGAQHLCRQHGACLIVDEVQTGFGRTGRLFACEHAGLEPDFLCLAKAIAGGFPMGATLIGRHVPKLTPLSHGTTFGGNPLGCAAALAAIRFIEEENLAERAAVLGSFLFERLGEIRSPHIREVRGLGLMVGIELKEKVKPYLGMLMERGVLAMPAGPTVLRLLPPLVISRDELDGVVNAIEATLSQTATASASET